MEFKKGYTAHARYVRMSPFKVRRIADKVRKKPYGDAIALLENLPHKGARLLRKVIQSAAANALYTNKNLDEELLYVRDLQINEAVRMKRKLAPGTGQGGQTAEENLPHIGGIG